MRYNEDAVRAAMPSRAQKEIDRAEIKKQLDEWLARGNIIKVVRDGVSGIEDCNQLSISQQAERARKAR